MKIFSSIFKFFKPEPQQALIFGVIVVVFGIIFAMYLRNNQSNPNYSVQLETEQNGANPVGAGKLPHRVNDFIAQSDKDENVNLTNRMTESSGIALGLSLNVLNRTLIERVPTPDLKTLMESFSKSPLLPPYAQVVIPANPQYTAESYGAVATSRGVYFVRYRTNPLSFEILSIGKNGLSDGVVFLLRIPDTKGIELQQSENPGSALPSQMAGNFATLYTAPKNMGAYIPAPFAPASVYKDSGWTIEALRQNQISAERLAELQKFLTSN